MHAQKYHRICVVYSNNFCEITAGKVLIGVKLKLWSCPPKCRSHAKVYQALPLHLSVRSKVICDNCANEGDEASINPPFEKRYCSCFCSSTASSMELQLDHRPRSDFSTATAACVYCLWYFCFPNMLAATARQDHSSRQISVDLYWREQVPLHSP